MQLTHEVDYKGRLVKDKSYSLTAFHNFPNLYSSPNHSTSYYEVSLLLTSPILLLLSSPILLGPLISQTFYYLFTVFTNFPKHPRSRCQHILKKSCANLTVTKLPQISPKSRHRHTSIGTNWIHPRFRQSKAQGTYEAQLNRTGKKKTQEEEPVTVQSTARPLDRVLASRPNKASCVFINYAQSYTATK